MHYAKLARDLIARTNEAQGQIMAEYGLIMAIIVIAAVGALALIGSAVSAPFSTLVEAAGLGS